MFNFEPFDQRCYGHVEITPRRINGEEVQPQLHLEKLGARKSDASVDGIRVVWTAPDARRGGRAVVGWFNNATVFRHRQYPKGRLKRARNFRDWDGDYRVSAAEGDCTLLSSDERQFTIPPRRSGQKGVPGQFGAFYPSAHGPLGEELEVRLNDFISRTSGKLNANRQRLGGNFQADVAFRLRIETAAIECAAGYFESQGYEVTSRERENVGYDLLAVRSEETLCIEVKGRSGREVCAEFSPNEYKAIQSAEKGTFHQGSYQICIVTSALVKPDLKHFSYFPRHEGKMGRWVNVDGSSKLSLAAVTSARATAES